MKHPDGCCQKCGEQQKANTAVGVICPNGHYSNGGSEHLLEESLGTFGTTIYECRHCGERSPDKDYFGDIPCPPTIDDE